MNLHELVNKYIRTWETLQSFVGHLKNGNDHDSKFFQDFDKLTKKFNNIFCKIMTQYKKVDPIVAFYEMMRARYPELDEEKILELMCKKLNDDE